MGSQLVFVVLGGILILTGVIGGGFELRELKIPPVKWPTRIVAFVAGFVFIFLGIGANVASDGSLEATRVHAREPEAPKSAHPANVEDDAWLRAALKTAVLKASDAQIRAQRENDARLLDGALVGDAHTKIVEGMQALAKEQLYSVSELRDQQFESFSVDPTGQRAEVRVTETWSSAWHSSQTGECRLVVPPHRVPQSVSLSRQGSGWVVSDFTTYGESPASKACP